MQQHIIFYSNNEKIAINILSIERIIDYTEPRKVPESSKYILGVINYKNMVVPLIDLTYKLYNIKKDNNKNKKIIIVKWKNKLLALLVEDILGIKKYENVQYDENLDNTNIIKDYIEGFIIPNEKEEIIIVLDIEKIFTKKESKELLIASKKSSVN